MKNHRLKRRLLSNMNSFDYNYINLVTLLSTIKYSSFRIASCLQELLLFVNDNSLLMTIPFSYEFVNSGGHPCPMDTILVSICFGCSKEMSH